MFNAIFNSIWVISRWPVHLSMLSWSSFYQYSTQYSFQANGCFSHKHCQNNGHQWERNEFCRNDHHQCSERLLAELGMEPATSCSQVQNATDWAMVPCRLTYSYTMIPFDTPRQQAFWKHFGKKEIARNEQFLLFPQCFLPIWITFCHFRQIWNCCLPILSVWKSLKFVVW